jgi:PIN domain nuclease of toxin-antitoxin system
LIVLDTHAWIWWVSDPRRLSAPARRRIDQGVEESAVHVSAISCWEVSLLVRRGRLELSMALEEWIRHSESLPYVHFVAVDPQIALLSNALPGAWHPDPADRIILATALHLGAVLVSKDGKLRRLRSAVTVW